MTEALPALDDFGGGRFRATSHGRFRAYFFTEIRPLPSAGKVSAFSLPRFFEMQRGGRDCSSPL